MEVTKRENITADKNSYQRKYYQDHKDYFLEYNRVRTLKYYNEHKDIINKRRGEKIICEQCGETLRRDKMNSHIKNHHQ